jgi:hypothetical protein
VSPVDALPAGEELVASIVVSRLPKCGGYMLRYRVPGRELLDGATSSNRGPVAGCFAVHEDEVLDLGLAMVKCDRAGVRAAFG